MVMVVRGKKAKIGEADKVEADKARAAPEALAKKGTMAKEKVPVAGKAEATGKAPGAKAVLVIKVMAAEKEAPKTVADQGPEVQDKIRIPMADARFPSSGPCAAGPD